SPLPGLVQGPRRRDPLAQLLGLLGAGQRGQIERGEIPLALAREDEWQGDRSLEQVRPARLARALDRSGDIQDVVEHLEREPDAAGERAESGGHPRGPRRRRERSPAAGGLAQRGGLLLAAAHIALARDLPDAS